MTILPIGKSFRAIATLICCLTLTLFVPKSNAQDDAEPAESQAIVAIADAPVMAGDERIGQVPLGTIVIQTRHSSAWRYIPALRGWLHSKNLVPVDGAVAAFTERIENDPSAANYQLRGIAHMTQEHWAPAAQDLEKAYDLGDSSVALHFSLGTCYERLDQLAPALSEFDAVLKAYPDEAPSYLARGNILLRQGQNAAALRDFEKAVELVPDSAEAHNLRGVALRNLERFDEALNAYHKALELQPDFTDALANRGYIHKVQGDYEAALADYDRAAKLATDSAAIQNDLAWLLATCPQPSIRDATRAVALAESACAATESPNADYLDTLAAAYAQAERFEEAVETAKLALSQASEDNRGPIEERLERYQNGKAYIDSVEP